MEGKKKKEKIEEQKDGDKQQPLKYMKLETNQVTVAEEDGREEEKGKK